MKSIKIGENEANQRLDKFLTKTLPNLPQSLMYKYIRTKRIKVNRKRAEISTRLCLDDIVDLYINDEFFEQPEKNYDFLHASTSLNIIYEDENLLILNKKAGVLSHPDDREYTDTLISRVKRYLYEKGEYNPEDELSFTPALINRIDRNTGGIVLAAKNAETLRIMNQKMKDRELHKYYLCVVHGKPSLPRSSADTRASAASADRPSPDRADWTVLSDWLIKDENKNRVFVYNSPVPGAKQIKTKYRVLDTQKNLSLVEVELLTGRTHQIRAHFASIGCPLFGDGKYGKNSLSEKGYKKQFLYSYKIGFDFTTDAGKLEYLNGRTFEAESVWFAEQFPDY